MTENEAKTKWCPFARVDADGAGGSNRYPEVEDDGSPTPPGLLVAELTNTCIGSACMAWRWDDVPNPEYDRQRHVFMGGGFPPALTPPMTIKSDTDGHCGLAGRP